MAQPPPSPQPKDLFPAVAQIFTPLLVSAKALDQKIESLADEHAGNELELRIYHRIDQELITSCELRVWERAVKHIQQLPAENCTKVERDDVWYNNVKGGGTVRGRREIPYGVKSAAASVRKWIFKQRRERQDLALKRNLVEACVLRMTLSSELEIDFQTAKEMITERKGDAALAAADIQYSSVLIGRDERRGCIIETRRCARATGKLEYQVEFEHLPGTPREDFLRLAFEICTHAS